MIYLGFLLHIYQPPDQFDEVLERIVAECYRPLLELLAGRRDARFTLNLCWSLTEMWLDRGYADLMEPLRQVLEAGTVEITGTAAYHPILPLIPPQEARRQVRLNEERHRRVLGSCYRPRGLFPPEMAFGHELPPLVEELGYDWTITEDIPFCCLHQEPPYNYVATSSGVPVLLRSSLWSNKISMETDSQGGKFGGEQVARWLAGDLEHWFGGRDGYLVLAMDGETFGHHIPGYVEAFLVPFLDTLRELSGKIRLVHLSELVDRFPHREMDIPPGSWSTSAEDFWNGDFFPLWKGRYNRAHQLLWQLTDLALEGVRELQETLDRSLNSCTWWWAAREPDRLPPITRAGMEMLLEVIRQAAPHRLEEATALAQRLERCFEGPPGMRQARPEGGSRCHRGGGGSSPAA